MNPNVPFTNHDIFIVGDIAGFIPFMQAGNLYFFVGNKYQQISRDAQVDGLAGGLIMCSYDYHLLYTQIVHSSIL